MIRDPGRARGGARLGSGCAVAGASPRAGAGIESSGAPTAGLSRDRPGGHHRSLGAARSGGDRAGRGCPGPDGTGRGGTRRRRRRGACARRGRRRAAAGGVVGRGVAALPGASGCGARRVGTRLALGCEPGKRAPRGVGPGSSRPASGRARGRRSARCATRDPARSLPPAGVRPSWAGAGTHLARSWARVSRRDRPQAWSVRSPHGRRAGTGADAPRRTRLLIISSLRAARRTLGAARRRDRQERGR